jgi:RimJ/RimL family protein N-acetyltransferase
MSFPELVTTARLCLRRWDAERHTPALAAINAEPSAVEFLNDGIPYTAEESRRQSERFAAHWASHGFGLWAVEHGEETLGFTGLAHPLWFPQYAAEVEVGWRLHPAAWGHGYATEAARAALAAATHLELERLIATIDPANTRSIAVATRLGMTLDATVAHPQRPGDIAIYTIPSSGTI